METKKIGKLPLVSKATMEFAAAILAAAVLFSILNYAGVFEQLYSLPAQQHKALYKLLFLAAILAAVMVIFASRRWLELRKAYKKLAQSDEKLHLQSMILDEIGDGITATDLEGKITYVNRAQCNMIKRSTGEIVGRPIKVYDRDGLLDSIQQKIIQTTLSKGNWSGEFTGREAGGGKIIIDCHTWLMKDKNGMPTGMCGVSRNITERKEREQELLKHKRYIEALDAAAGILLHSISETPYEEFLAALGPASGVDRVLLFFIETDPDGKPDIPIRAQWNANDVTAVTGATRKFFVEKIWPNWEKVFSRNEPVCLLSSNSPPEEQAFWDILNIKALLALPIIIDGRLEGFITFDNCTEYRQWTKSEIEFLHTTANNLASAIKRLEIKKELQEQRDFAKRLIETAQTIVLVLDKNANIITFNPYFEKLSGWHLEEVKGKNWFDTFLPQEDREKIRKLFKTSITSTSTKGNVNSIITKDGQRRYIEWFDEILKDENGKVTALLSTGQDITERLKTEQELKDSEARLKTIFDNSRDGMVLADIETRKIPMYNKTMCEMLGYTDEEMSHISVKDIHPEKDLPHVIEVFEGQARGDIKTGEGLPIKRKDGSIFYADITSSPITLSGRRYLVGSFRDITERKWAQEEIRKTKQQIEHILGLTKTGLDIIDSKFNVRYIDPWWQNIYGDPAGRKCYEYFMGRNEVCPDCGIKKALETKSITVTEETLVRENNRPIQVITMPFQDENGEWLVAEVNVDISKRKQAEEEIKKSRKILQDMIDAMPFGVMVVGKDKKIRLANAAARQLTGYSEKELSDQPCHKTLCPAEENACPILDLNQTVERTEKKLITKEGRQIPIFQSVVHLKLGGEDVLLEAFVDITERKRAEELLRDSEHRYRMIFDGITDAVFIHGVVDNQMPGTFIAVNDVACKRLGYSREELLRMSPRDIDAPESTADVRGLTEKLLRGENALIEQIHVTKDGRRIPVEINSQHFVMQGRPLVLSVVRDITERKRAEEELKKAHLELEQRVEQRTVELRKANTQLLRTIEERNRIQKILQETEKVAGAGKLAAQIAHEINNPLAGIKNSFLLIKDAVPPNHRYFEYVGRIEKEIDRVSQIVRQMFDLYRPDTRPANKFRLYDTIKDIVELLKIAWQEKHINIEIDCNEKTTVILSEALLRQIIYNIVQNAIQASESDTTVKINAYADDGKLNLSISDEGPGIDNSIKDKIFEPFFTTGIGGPKSGLGLGLAITKDIINAMDGAIDFTSEKDKGTVFNIFIPMENEPAE